MASFMRETPLSTNHFTNKMCCPLKIRAENHLHMMMIVLFLCFFLTTVSCNSNVTPQNGQNDPTPKPWPEQFHSILVLNNTKTTELQVINLWYDWINGRNLNLIQHQLGKLLYDVEHNNGTSYYFTRGGESGKECKTIHFDVGILTPNWLEGANYLGQRHIDGFLCNVWEKVEFLWYYEDVITQRPVGWTFYTGRAVHVITFEVGAVLEDSEWQAPVYCFDKAQEEDRSFSSSDRESRQLLRESVPLSLAVM